MIEDEKIVELFFERSEQAIQELGNKYGKAISTAKSAANCHTTS